MEIINLGKQNSLLNQYISEIRDKEIQKDRLRFRRNIERLGEIFAYEISKVMKYSRIEVTTSLGLARVSVPAEQPVLATILRAGLPLHQGILNYFDKADNAFVSAYRHHYKDGSFDIKIEYLSSPSINKRQVILADPMLATGDSMLLAYKALLSNGKPKHTHLVSVIASSDGIRHVKSHMPENSTLWVAAVDDELTVQSYIVPGLGDAGDLAFGEKK